MGTEAVIDANSILVLRPHKFDGTWAFDDERTGLVREAFILGIEQILDHATKDIPGADQGFRLLFSKKAFPGYHLRLDWKREELGGNWYFCRQTQTEGWTHPSSRRYYREVPESPFVRAEAIK